MSTPESATSVAASPAIAVELPPELADLFAMHGRFAGQAWDAFARAWDQGSKFGRLDGNVKARAFIEYYREFLHRDRADGGR